MGSPGWGYAASKAARHAATMQPFSLSDGLWVSDVGTGKGRLVVSLAQLREATTAGQRVTSKPIRAKLGLPMVTPFDDRCLCEVSC